VWYGLWSTQPLAYSRTTLIAADAAAITIALFLVQALARQLCLWLDADIDHISASQSENELKNSCGITGVM
jgi:hypothetical protein